MVLAAVAEEEAKNLLGFTAGLVVDLADGLLKEELVFVGFSEGPELDARDFSLAELDMVEVLAEELPPLCCLEETPVPGIFRRSCRRFSISLFLVSKVFKVFSLSLFSWDPDMREEGERRGETIFRFS